MPATKKTAGYDTIQPVKDRALDELCFQLSVSLKPEFENRLLKKDRYEGQQVASSPMVTSRKVLSGVTEKDRYIDSRRQRRSVRRFDPGDCPTKIGQSPQ